MAAIRQDLSALVVSAVRFRHTQVQTLASQLHSNGKLFQKAYALRSFVEKEVHDGEIGLKAVLLGKDLEVRLFQAQVLDDAIIPFRVYRVSQVITAGNLAIRCLKLTIM